MNKMINRIILFENTSQTGLHLLPEGAIFAVINDEDNIEYHKLISKNNINSSTTIQSAIDNGWVGNLRAGDVEPTLRVYSAGESFHLNELFTDSTKSKFYVALQDFTASGNFDQDKEDGFIKSIGETTYKQIEATVNSGDIYVIPLENSNAQYNKHCFIEQIQAPQSDILVLFSDFNETDEKWYYDSNWVTQDGSIYLKNLRLYDTTENQTDNGDQIFEKTIDINDYQEIKYVGVSAI